MCKWGTLVKMKLTIPARLSHKNEDYQKDVGVDECIAPIVSALNKGGMQTIASCCGHDEIWGSIILEDGRELIIAPDYESARAFFKVFGRTIHGDKIKNMLKNK